MRPIPKTIKIGHIPYKIIVDRDAVAHAQANARTPIYGESSVGKQYILVNPDQGPESMADTLLHEILHQALAVSGYRAEADDEERFVLAATGPLLGVLRAHPNLVAYLTGRD